MALLAFQLSPRSSEGGGGVIAGCLSLRQCGEGIAFAGQTVRQLHLPPGFTIEPSQLRGSGRECGIGDPPFGLNPGLICGRLGKRQFGGAQAAIGIIERSGDQRTALVIGGQRRFASGQFTLQLAQRFGGVAGQPVGIAAVFLQPLVLTIQVFEPVFSGFELAGKLGHPVAVGGAIIAPVGQFLAGLGQRLRGLMLGILRGFHRGLRRRHAGLGPVRLRPRGFGSGSGIAPAGEDQPGFGQFDLVAQRLVTFGGAGLATERADLLIELAHQVFQPGQIGLGRAQFLLGILAAHVQPGDPGGFLQHHPAFGRFGSDYGGDLALTDQRGGVRPGGGIGEDQIDVFGSDIAAIDAVSAARAALDPADDFEFAVAVMGVQHDLGKIARRARCGSGEDHVFHPAAAHRFRAAFAHHPADRFKQVGFAAAVGADHPGQAGFDPQFSRLNKAFEASQFEPVDLHLLDRLPPASPV